MQRELDLERRGEGRTHVPHPARGRSLRLRARRLRHTPRPLLLRGASLLLDNYEGHRLDDKCTHMQLVPAGHQLSRECRGDR